MPTLIMHPMHAESMSASHSLLAQSLCLCSYNVQPLRDRQLLEELRLAVCMGFGAWPQAKCCGC